MPPPEPRHGHVSFLNVHDYVDPAGKAIQGLLAFIEWDSHPGAQTIVLTDSERMRAGILSAFASQTSLNIFVDEKHVVAVASTIVKMVASKPRSPHTTTAKTDGPFELKAMWFPMA